MTKEQLAWLAEGGPLEGKDPAEVIEALATELIAARCVVEAAKSHVAADHPERHSALDAALSAYEEAKG